ncbi:unnamed protein product, partial [Polarella glacialis]
AKTTVKEHSFFKDINWEDVEQGLLQPPFFPEVGDSFAADNKNFGHFQESVDDHAPYVPPENGQDCFSQWEEHTDLREEALQLAKELAEKRLRDKQLAKEFEAQELQRLEELHRRKAEELPAADRLQVDVKLAAAPTLLDSKPAAGLKTRVAGPETEKPCCELQ